MTTLGNFHHSLFRLLFLNGFFRFCQSILIQFLKNKMQCNLQVILLTLKVLADIFAALLTTKAIIEYKQKIYFVVDDFPSSVVTQLLLKQQQSHVLCFSSKRQTWNNCSISSYKLLLTQFLFLETKAALKDFQVSSLDSQF